MNIDKDLEKALKNLELRLPKTNFGGWNYGNEISAWRRCFEIIQPLHGANRKLRAIANEHDMENLRDTLTEIKFAVIFEKLGFQVEIEPLANDNKDSENPDLRIKREGYSSLVDVKRFRPPGRFSPGQRLQKLEISKTYELPQYGDPRKDLQKIFTEIEKKFRQTGAEGIIAIWNSNDELTPEEVKSAVQLLKLYSTHSQKSSFVLLRGDANEKFYCFRLRNSLTPQLEQWISQLEQVVPDNFLSRLSSE